MQIRTISISATVFAILAAASASAVASAGVLDALKIMANNKPPSTPFDPRAVPPVPDYGKRTSWAALPDMRDASDVAPAGVGQIDQRTAPADVFYIYPTTFFSKTQWNASITDATNNAKIDAFPLRSQGSAFNACCAVYAPRYRQMTLGAYVKWSASSEAAQDLAYQDVSHAFDEYLAKYNKGRPFVIAGHSQGARLARRLIAERIDGRPIARRMVAAYLIGHWIERSWFDGLRDFKPCATATDTRCIVTYSSFEEGRKATFQRITLGRSSSYKPETLRRPYVCINPVTWTTGPATSPITRQRGGWLPGESGIPRAEPQMVTARCLDGAVYVSKLRSDYTSKAIPFGNFHNIDYNIFYMDIRANAVARVAAFTR
jgi:hypothetical protein